jgi:uncharacterized phage-associated protein
MKQSDKDYDCSRCEESLDYSDSAECPPDYNGDALPKSAETSPLDITPDNGWSDSPKSETYQYVDSVSVFDVAAYIVNKLGEMSAMKLQKLVYYCQAWSLVWDEQPLFRENIEAWANGPVIRELFNFHRGRFRLSAIEIGNPDVLNDVQLETIDAVLEYYGDKPAQWLIDLTHIEKPWKDARRGMSCSERGNRVIAHDAIAEYYSSLPAEE